jgi:riboflavin synthase
MFTGIVEEMGVVERIEPRGNLSRLWFRASLVLSDAHVGDSLCHNGCCLTIAELRPPLYGCDVMGETLAVTTLGVLRPGMKVNLERALSAGGRFGGHIVQGHVDGVGRLVTLTRDDRWVTFGFEAPAAVLPYVVAKGSVCVDGISLTVVERLAGGFTVSLIPHTLEVTTLGARAVGDAVNLEADVLAKYVEAQLAARFGGGEPKTPPGGDGPAPLTWAWLAEHGYGA